MGRTSSRNTRLACNAHDDLAAAKARSAAAGKPILLLQALGDLEGFA